MKIKKKIITISLVGVLATGSASAFATMNQNLNIKQAPGFIERPVLENRQALSAKAIFQKLGLSNKEQKKGEAFLRFLKKSKEDQNAYLENSVEIGIITEVEKEALEKMLDRAGAKLRDGSKGRPPLQKSHNKSLISRMLNIENETQRDVIYEKLMLFHQSTSEKKQKIIQSAKEEGLITEKESEFLFEWSQSH